MGGVPLSTDYIIAIAHLTNVATPFYVSTSSKSVEIAFPTEYKCVEYILQALYFTGLH